MSQKGNYPIASQDDHEESYVVPVVSYEDDDYPEHNDSGFCDNMAHECHENQDSMTKLNHAIVEGLITTDDADRIYRGKTVI
ncbi:MAG TPA: hypothetical protein VFB60_10250 [Ktedonobacteraceae bacterium]|nr:hypothetical protein [Ktedonobacteraceae bacterium]